MSLNKTLQDLKLSVQQFLNRNDPEVVDAIPQFIMLAEQEFSRTVKIPLDEGVYLYIAQFDGEGIPIPEDCLSPLNVAVLTDGVGDAKPQSCINIGAWAHWEEIYNKASDGNRYYNKYLNTWRFYPELKQGEGVSIIYHKDLEPLNLDSDTNASLKYGYDLMLYWSLKHAAVFMRDPEQEQYWAQKAEEALATMQITFDEQKWGGSPLRVLGA